MTQVKSELTTKKDFRYTHGVCSLSFTLNMDNKDEFRSFRKCLIEALKDIEEEIKK